MKLFFEKKDHHFGQHFAPQRNDDPTKEENRLHIFEANNRDGKRH